MSSYARLSPSEGGERSWIVLGLAAIGLFVTLQALLSLYFLLSSILRPGISIKRFGAKQGAWAVVTGATAGIGLEFSKQLGQAGYNVLIIARDANKLASAEKEIKSKAPSVQVKTHVLDFKSADDAEYAKLASVLDGLDVGVLVNNVGQSHAYPEYFHLAPEDEALSILAVNTISVVRVTRLVVSGMVKRKRGLVLNISSFSGYTASPLLAVYAATKAFVSTFSQALGNELDDYGIVVRSVNAYFIVSELSKIRRANFFTPLPKAYVRSVLSHIGQSSGPFGSWAYISTPYWTHAIAQAAIDRVGTWSFWQNYTKAMHKDIRKRYFRKLEKTKAQ